MDIANKKILVTGGSGFVGSYVIKELIKNHVNPKNISAPRSKEYDLRKDVNCRKVVKNQDIIIHLAGNVGGISKNQRLPATLLYDNLLMGIHLIDAATKSKVEKIVIIGTICAYPKYVPVPFKEEDLWSGFPEKTNAPYGLAKKMLLVALQSYQQEHGLKGIYLLPVNIYGPGDSFDPEISHVIPALIHKIAEAIRQNKKYIEVWGDGTPTREFLYVEDAARAFVMATKKYEKTDPVNIGSGKEISIKDLVRLIARLMKYAGEIVFDTTKPNGQPRRLLDVSKAYNEFQFRAKIPFSIGLEKTIKWYLHNKKRL
ncbi:MAG: GDP-L-fucose synthase [Candidatus Levybacteria bacterium]|nr:GDP-L-fucose synthase [Candidatus Levybacteria bacterium]